MTVHACVKSFICEHLARAVSTALGFIWELTELDAVSQHVENAGEEEKLFPDHECNAGSGGGEHHP